MRTNTTGVLWWTQSQVCASLHPFSQWPGGQIVAGWCMINGYSSTQKVIKRKCGPGGLEWLIQPNINRQFISYLLISINTQLGSGGVLKSIPAVSGWEAGIYSRQFHQSITGQTHTHPHMHMHTHTYTPHLHFPIKKVTNCLSQIVFLRNNQQHLDISIIKPFYCSLHL